MHKSIGVVGAGGIAALGLACGILLTGSASASSTSSDQSNVPSIEVGDQPEPNCVFLGELDPAVEPVIVDDSAGLVDLEDGITAYGDPTDAGSTWMSVTVDTAGEVTIEEGDDTDLPPELEDLPSASAEHAEAVDGTEPTDTPCGADGTGQSGPIISSAVEADTPAPGE